MTSKTRVMRNSVRESHQTIFDDLTILHRFDCKFDCILGKARVWTSECTNQGFSKQANNNRKLYSSS